MIRLHRKFPAIHRPFKAPLFPLTPLIASFTCLLVIVFSDLKPLLFTLGVIGIFGIYYFAQLAISAWMRSRVTEVLPGRERIVVPVFQTKEADSLISLASILAQADQDLNVCMMSVVAGTLAGQPELHDQYMQSMNKQRMAVMEKFIHYAVERNVPMYTKIVTGESFAQSILKEVENDTGTRMIIVRWPERHIAQSLSEEAVKQICRTAKTNVGVRPITVWRKSIRSWYRWEAACIAVWQFN
jgi:hypothetical protein